MWGGGCSEQVVARPVEVARVVGAPEANDGETQLTLRIETQAFDEYRQPLSAVNAQIVVLTERGAGSESETTVDVTPDQGHVPIGMRTAPSASTTRRVKFRSATAPQVSDGTGQIVADPASPDLLPSAATTRLVLGIPPRPRARNAGHGSRVRAILGLDALEIDWDRLSRLSGASLARVGIQRQLQIVRGDTVIQLNGEQGTPGVRSSHTTLAGKTIAQSDLTYESLTAGVIGIRQRVTWMRNGGGAGSGWVRVSTTVTSLVMSAPGGPTS